MSLSTDSTLSFYLRQQHIERSDFNAYQVSQRIDLICSQACHLAQMHSQPLHPVHILKAILHIPGHAAEQILTRHGLTLEKIHNTPLTHLDMPFDFDRLFATMIAAIQDGTSLGTEHLLLALLEEEGLQACFSFWGIDAEHLTAEAQMAAR